LKDALIVNPYDPDEIAEAMHEALVMSLVARKRRHARLMDCLRNLTASDYYSSFVGALSAKPATRSAA
jgi:trehalose 6-phosphate synthase